jgi:hypothetical protein
MRISIDKADQLFSRWIRNRDNWTCKRCGKKYEKGDQRLQNSHFYGRSHENTRFEPDNCDAMCFGCHQFFTSNPADYASWKIKQLGQKGYDLLMLRAYTYKKKDRKMEVIKWSEALKRGSKSIKHFITTTE